MYVKSQVIAVFWLLPVYGEQLVYRLLTGMKLNISYTFPVCVCVCVCVHGREEEKRVFISMVIHLIQILTTLQ